MKQSATVPPQLPAKTFPELQWPAFRKEILIAIVLVLASHAFVSCFAKVFAWEHKARVSTFSEFCRWDCGFYSRIMQFGYDAQPHLGARGDIANWHFFPLFPMFALPLMRVLKMNPDLAAVMASKVFLFTAILAFLWMVRDRLDGLKDTVLAAMLVAFNPYVIYAHGGYAESLYFTVAAAAFALLGSGRWMGAGVAGGLLSATRMVGVVFTVPYLIASLRRAGIRQLTSERRLDVLLGLLLCPLGLSLYLLFLYHRTGDALAPVHSFAAWRLKSGNPLAVLSSALHAGRWQRYWGWTAIMAFVVSAWLAIRREFEMAAFLAICVLVPLGAEIGGMPRFVWWQPPVLYAAFLLLKRYPALQLLYGVLIGGMAALMAYLWTSGSVAVV